MSDTEKQAIERATAEGFLALYNAQESTDYCVKKIAGHRESPDVYCVNSNGKELFIEITATEDNPKDISALLGRSDHKDLDELQNLLRRGEMQTVKIQNSQLEGNVLGILIKRLSKKFEKSYGLNVALVVRGTSGVNWDWDLILPTVRQIFCGKRNPYERGVWLLSFNNTQLTRIF